MKGIFSTLTFAALLLLGSVACAGPSLDDEDLRIAEEQPLGSSLGQGPIGPCLGGGPMGRSDLCLEDAQAAFSVQPHHWQMHVARTIESWHVLPDEGRMGGTCELPKEQRMAALLKQCDAIGPDPLFGGELAQQRVNFPPFQYLLLRMHAERLRLAPRRREPIEPGQSWLGTGARPPAGGRNDGAQEGPGCG